MAAKNYHKMSVWFIVATALCAFRSALPISVAVAYIQVGCRVIQMIGAILKKRTVSRVGYILSTIMITILFFTVMIDMSNIITFF